MNDDCESVIVGKGCSAVLAEHGEHGGWEATLTDTGGSNGDGRYTMKDLEAVGAKPVCLEFVSARKIVPHLDPCV